MVAGKKQRHYFRHFERSRALQRARSRVWRKANRGFSGSSAMQIKGTAFPPKTWFLRKDITKAPLLSSDSKRTKEEQH